MKRIILTLFLSAMVLSASADIIIGTIVSGKDSQPIPYANIAMLRASDSTLICGTTANEKGEFRLSFLHQVLYNLDGEWVGYLLRVSAIGYETLWQEGDLSYIMEYQSTLPPHPVVFALQPETTTLGEVRVTAQRPIYTIEGEKSLYNTADDPSVQTGTASDALQNAPGIEVDASGNITLRGTQAVDVWINGKPSHLEGEALVQYIKMLPANMIQRIEVIKNPSARYGGGTPVVNIVTQRKILNNQFVSFGANGNSNAKHWGVKPWMSYVYSNEKWNVNFYTSYSRHPTDETRHSRTTLHNDNGSVASELESETHTQKTDQKLNMFLGVNYEIDSANEVSLYLSTWGMLPTTYDFTGWRNWTLYTPEAQNYNYTLGTMASTRSTAGYGVLNYTHKFDSNGHHLSLDLFGNLNRFLSHVEEWEDYEVQRWRNCHSLNDQTVADQSLSLTLDYMLPFGDKDTSGICRNTLEAGIIQGWSLNPKITRRDTLDRISGMYLTDSLRTFTSYNTPRFTQAYVTLSRRMGGLTAKVGLRAVGERLRQSFSDREGYDFEQPFRYLIPTLNVSHTTRNMHNFVFSYSRRYNTPSTSRLSRFKDYGTTSYTTGNPDLTGCVLHSIELEWNKYFEKFGNVGVEVFYGASHNEIGDITDVTYDDILGMTIPFTRPMNVGESHNFGLRANATYRPTAFLNVRFSATVFDDYYNLQYRPGEYVSNEMVCYNLRLNVWTELWNKLQLFATGSYTSRRQYLTNVGTPSKRIDLGMSADFFKRKLSLYLSADDIFDWGAWTNQNSNAYYSNTSTTIPETRMIVFGATLRLGKMELESLARQGARGEL